jgi:hypothetical protein
VDVGGESTQETVLRQISAARGGQRQESATFGLGCGKMKRIARERRWPVAQRNVMTLQSGVTFRNGAGMARE